MARFTFSQRILPDGDQPNSAAINDINKTFEDFLSTGLVNENVIDESIRTRHLAQPATVVSYVDCSDDLFSYGTTEGGTTHITGLVAIGITGSFEVIRTAATDTDNTAKLLVRHDGNNPKPGEKVFEVTMIYYPYSSSAKTEVCPAYQAVGSSSWVAMEALKRTVGIKAGRSSYLDTQPYKNSNMNYPDHPCLWGLPTDSKRNTGKPRTDCISTVAHGAPVIINFQVGDSVVDGKAIDEIQAFGLAIKHHTDDNITTPFNFRSVCCLHDRLIMMITARDVE